MQQVGPYQVLEEIARGGMGVVLRARAPNGQLVAIKLLHAADPSPQQLQRFRTEFETLRRLQHPHLVPVLDAGQHQGHAYLVLELVEGESLQRHLDRGGALRPEAAAELIRKVADAVGSAHQISILHRDLKPDNILLDANGEPRLTDFGLAKDLASDSKLSRTGSFLGSPGFWPPEQAAGDLQRIGPHSDVYGLGATLYALLTRRPPLVGGSLPETIRMTESVDPGPPSAENPAVNPALDAICLKCLRKDPHQRYRSASVLARDLERYLAGLQPLALDAERGSARAPLVIAASILLLGGVGAAWLLGRGPDTREGQPVSQSPSVSPTPAAVVTPSATPVAPSPLPVAPSPPPASPAATPAEDLAALHELARLEPESFDAQNDLALALMRVGRHLEAEPALRRAHELRPEHLPTLANVIHILRLREAYGEATQLLVQGMQREPKHPALAVERAWLALAREKFDKAEALFAPLLEQHPKNFYVLAGVGRLRLRQERWREAERLLQESLGRGSPSAWTWFDLAVARGELGDHRLAVAAYDAALKRDPDLLPALINRAHDQAQLGLHEAALADLDLALELNPMHPQARHNRAYERVAAGQWQAAEEDLRVALEARPDYVRAHLLLAKVLREEGRLQEALRSVERAEQHAPQPWLLFGLERGLILERLGDAEGARTALRPVLQQLETSSLGSDSSWSLDEVRAAAARVGLLNAESRD